MRMARAEAGTRAGEARGRTSGHTNEVLEQGVRFVACPTGGNLRLGAQIGGCVVGLLCPCTIPV